MEEYERVVVQMSEMEEAVERIRATQPLVANLVEAALAVQREASEQTKDGGEYDEKLEFVLVVAAPDDGSAWTMRCCSEKFASCTAASLVEGMSTVGVMVVRAATERVLRGFGNLGSVLAKLVSRHVEDKEDEEEGWWTAASKEVH